MKAIKTYNEAVDAGRAWFDRAFSSMDSTTIKAIDPRELAARAYAAGMGDARREIRESMDPLGGEIPAKGGKS